MIKFQINRRLFAGLFFLLLLVLASLLYYQNALPRTDRLIFLSVGQGDAIFFETSRGERILIDGGPDGSADTSLNRYLPWWDRRLNAVIATHSDLDHIGGLEKVITNFAVDGLYLAKNIETKPALESLIGQARRKKVPVWLLTDDYQLNFSSTTYLKLLLDPTSGTSNDNSIASVLHDQEADVIMMADVGVEQEKKLLDELPGMQPEIIKIGHHGSDLSTGEALLSKWQPRDAVVSVGRNNRFGHPSPRVIKRLERNSVIIHRTDEVGDIVYHLIQGHWRVAP